MNTCSSCRWWQGGKLDIQLKRVGTCTHGPPIPFALPQQGPGGRVGLQVMAALPNTTGDFSCGRWEPKQVADLNVETTNDD